MPLAAETELSRWPPAAAGTEAYRRFLMPELSPYRSPVHCHLVERARPHLARAHREDIETPAGRVPLYTFDAAAGEAPRTVLLIHGWTSEAAIMSAFVEPLRQRGLTVVALDLPGHGFAEARRASMVDCARAVLAVADHLGPLHATVGHSMGGLIAVLAQEGGPPLDRTAGLGRLALIAAPNRLGAITDDFARHLGLTPAAKRVYEHQIERAGRRALARFTAAAMLSGRHQPLLLVQCRDDEVIDPAAASEIAAARPDAEVMWASGLGHARVLYAPPVVRAVRDFIARA